MKKTILFLICIIGVMSMCLQCPDDKSHEGFFLAKNSTDQTLFLRFNFGNGLGTKYEINSSKFLTLSAPLFPIEQDPYFDRFFDGLSEHNSGILSFQIWSVDSALLQEWYYADKDLPNKQFFNESSWDHEEKVYEDIIRSIWTFDILPEDITQPEP